MTLWRPDISQDFIMLAVLEVARPVAHAERGATAGVV